MPFLDPPDYLQHLQRESRRFADAVLLAPAAAPVPSCPGWSADDLLWHLTEVQWFWSEIVRRRARDPSEVEPARPARPGGRDALLPVHRASNAALLAALASADPGDAVWTWSDDRTVGFVLRRQAHEALVHRVDAELTAGARTAMDGRLSADGVDEALTVVHGCGPGERAGPPAAGDVVIEATDTRDAWLVTPVEADDGASGRSGVALAVRHPPPPDAVPAASVRGAAADLDCTLWNRPPFGRVEQTGDVAALAALSAVLTGGTR